MPHPKSWDPEAADCREVYPSHPEMASSDMGLYDMRGTLLGFFL